MIIYVHVYMTLYMVYIIHVYIHVCVYNVMHGMLSHSCSYLRGVCVCVCVCDGSYWPMDYVLNMTCNWRTSLHTWNC